MTKSTKTKQVFDYTKRFAISVNCLAIILIAVSGTTYNDGHFLLYAIILGWGIFIIAALERIIEVLDNK